MAPARILVVDDEPDFVETLGERLRFEQYEVISASSGSDALKKLSPPPDMILLDIMMPEMDGVAFFKTLRASPQTASLPVVFISVRSNAIDDPSISSDRQCFFVHKPFEMETLLNVIHEVLAGRKATS